MSRKALLDAVVDHLRSAPADGGLGLRADACGRSPLDGRPPARAGRQWVGVHGCSRSRTAASVVGLVESYRLLVTVTVRIDAPADRIDVATEDALLALTDRVRLALHLRREVAERANRAIGLDITASPVTGPRGFCNWLEFLGDTEPRVVGGDWFHAETESLAGLVCVLTFGDIVRAQDVAEGSDVEVT